MKDGPEGWEEVVREDMFLLCRRIFSLRIAVLLGGEGGVHLRSFRGCDFIVISSSSFYRFSVFIFT